MSNPFTQVPIVRFRDGQRTAQLDVTAAEVPLELRVDGRPFAVIMRTPGADRQLAAGFLLAERIIRREDDLATIEHCIDPLDAAGATRQNVINVALDKDAAARAAHLLSHRRDVMANAACGVCGRATLVSMREDLVPLDDDQGTSAAVVAELPRRLRERQPVFETTGGLHAAGMFTFDGDLVVVAEDVGRHNAVDKVTGTMLLREELPLSGSILCVSGRTSFEIVQKAWCAGIPVVASVSAPSSLAVSIAAEAHITLVGFVRDGGLNVYTGAHRIV